MITWFKAKFLPVGLKIKEKSETIYSLLSSRAAELGYLPFFEPVELEPGEIPSKDLVQESLVTPNKDNEKPKPEAEKPVEPLQVEAKPKEDPQTPKLRNYSDAMPKKGSSPDGKKPADASEKYYSGKSSVLEEKSPNTKAVIEKGALDTSDLLNSGNFCQLNCIYFFVLC